MKIVVIGGGISGLASAYRIQEAARAAGLTPEITVLERDAHLGGKIRSDRHEGWVVETGPNGYLDSKPGTVKLVKDLGLTEKVLPADEASKTRLLFLDGRLQALPSSPAGFMTSSVLPLSGRMRIMLEPFQKKGPEDETLADFGRRRLGRHAVERLLDPFVTGIYAGDPETLSVAAAFPAVKKLELEYGGRIEWRWDRFSFALTDFYGYNDIPHPRAINFYDRSVEYRLEDADELTFIYGAGRPLAVPPP